MDRSIISVNQSEEVIKVEDAKKTSATGLTRESIASAVCHDPVELLEDIFGTYYDEYGAAHNIKRFTWRNKNKIQVQVINYGARITSMKMPDRKGSVDDIVLGFDDIAGYVHYKDKYFGATIGRMSSMVRNSTFHINNKQYWLTPNSGPHHCNGGRSGLDQVVWTTFTESGRVIMSYVSPHMTEGYPGDLLIRIIFELSAKNEFSIRMEAQCTQPTIINLSNLTYFNLGGHHRGPNELYKHILTLNCNCFTPQTEGIPNGNIMNVVHSEFDFQIPKVLGKVMGIVPKDGFNQNLCINRGLDQDDCFVARALHPPSGRLLEMYSNQSGVQLNTANQFGYEDVMTMEQLMKTPESTPPKCDGSEALLRLYEKVHKEIKNSLTKDEENAFKEMYGLIKKIKELDQSDAPNNTPAEPVDETVEVAKEETAKKQKTLLCRDIEFTEMQIEYLNKILKVLCDSCDEEPCEDLKDIIETIISMAKIKETESKEKKEEEKEEKAETVEKVKEAKKQESVEEKISKKKSVNSTTTSKSRKRNLKQNFIPDYYKCTDKIIGKDRAHYRAHGGMALQTQNYPACANYKNFPNCILKPGETYTHTITYKFWIRAGNPMKWIKRNSGKNV